MTGESTPRRGTSGQIGRAMYQGYYQSTPERGAPEPARPEAPAAGVPTAELPPVVVTAEAPRAQQRQRQAPTRQQPAQRWDEDAVYRAAAQNINEGRVQVAGVGETVGLGRDTTVQGQRSQRAPHRTPTV